jgi:hypothetical protein
MRADRASVYNSAFNASSHEEALDFEKNNATPLVLQASNITMRKETFFLDYNRFTAVHKEIHAEEATF